jgi:diaminopimelate epimerase
MLKDGRIGGIPSSFTKMSGAGNDFLVFDERVSIGPREAETIRAVCRRGVGVGADGVLFVEAIRSGERSRVLLDYFNADGSRARFCANGTRCVARFAKERLGAGAEMVVATDWGDVPATVRDGAVTLRLPEAVALGARVDSYDRGRRLLEPEAVALAVGVPQLVVFTADGVEVETLELADLGPPLRRHPDLPDGANVTFVTPRGPSRLSVRSWERGVEAETLSCGSGVVAAAVVSAFLRGQVPPITAATRSGSALAVDFRIDGSLAKDVTLTGDARFVFEGTLTEEVL